MSFSASLFPFPIDNKLGTPYYAIKNLIENMLNPLFSDLLNLNH